MEKIEVYGFSVDVRDTVRPFFGSTNAALVVENHRTGERLFLQVDNNPQTLMNLIDALGEMAKRVVEGMFGLMEHERDLTLGEAEAMIELAQNAIGKTMDRWVVELATRDIMNAQEEVAAVWRMWVHKSNALVTVDEPSKQDEETVSERLEAVADGNL